MATCKDCIHEDLCGTFTRPCYPDEVNKSEILCKDFKNKADFVKVVRCKDCTHRRTDDFYSFYCRKDEVGCKDDDFCSDGLTKIEHNSLCETETFEGR